MQSTAKPHINGDWVFARLKEFARTKDLKKIHQNINRLALKLEIEIEILINWQLPDIGRKNNPDDYVFVRKDSESEVGGGVGCFFREDIKWQRRTDLQSASFKPYG